MGELLWLALKLWGGYLVWCWTGFAVTDRVIGRDRFFQWAASCGAMCYVYAAFWPLWLVYYRVRG